MDWLKSKQARCYIGFYSVASGIFLCHSHNMHSPVIGVEVQEKHGWGSEKKR